jgi:hypothetical protein
VTCEHLVELEQALIAAGFRELSRGQAWSQSCRERVDFDCFQELRALMRVTRNPGRRSRIRSFRGRLQAPV